MERKLLYAFRGWIAFVAFMDLGSAFRSYIEKRSFVDEHADIQYFNGTLDSIGIISIIRLKYPIENDVVWKVSNQLIIFLFVVFSRGFYNCQDYWNVLYFKSNRIGTLHTLYSLQTVSL